MRLLHQQGNQCMLQSEQERGLSHLTGKWMSRPALQRAMLNAGINIFVNEYTDKYVSACGKVCIFYVLALRKGRTERFGLVIQLCECQVLQHSDSMYPQIIASVTGNWS